MTNPGFSITGLDDKTNYGNKPGDGPLKPGGQQQTGLQHRDANLPSTPNSAVKRQASTLQLVRDVAGGTDTIRAKKEIYLPKSPGEHAEDYVVRLNRSVFFNVFAKTVEGLTGFVFSKDPVLGDDVPKPIVPHWENIDNAGTHGDVFARDLFDDALSAGHAGFIVEYPATGGKQTAADEKQAIRPYWVPVKKDNIVSFRVKTVNGRMVLTQLVLRECVMIEDGAFGEVEQIRYRVFRNIDGQVMAVVVRVTDDRQVALVDGPFRYPTQNEIPFVEVPTSGRVAFLESTPPLLDLAYMNIAHYQQWSDRATSLHMTCVPIWVETGIDQSDKENQTIIVGPNSARRFTNAQAKAGYESHDGAALAEVTKVIEELKSDMAVLGISMLAPSKRAAETAEAKRIDKAASDSQLSVSARGLQDALERGLYFHARYMTLNLGESGGSVTINRDFENLTMPADMLTAYVGAVSSAGLPVRMLLDAMQNGGLIDPSADLDDLELEMMANAQAAQEAKANALRDRANFVAGGAGNGKDAPAGGSAQ